MTGQGEFASERVPIDAFYPHDRYFGDRKNNQATSRFTDDDGESNSQQFDADDTSDVPSSYFTAWHIRCIISIKLL